MQKYQFFQNKYKSNGLPDEISENQEEEITEEVYDENLIEEDDYEPYDEESSPSYINDELEGEDEEYDQDGYPAEEEYQNQYQGESTDEEVIVEKVKGKRRVKSKSKSQVDINNITFKPVTSNQIARDYIVVDIQSTKTTVTIIADGCVQDTKLYTEGSMLDNENRYNALGFHCEAIFKQVHVIAASNNITELYCLVPSEKHAIKTSLESTYEELKPDEVILYNPVSCYESNGVSNNVTLSAYSICNKQIYNKAVEYRFNVSTRYLTVLNFLQQQPTVGIVDNLYTHLDAYFIKDDNIHVISNVKYTAKGAIERQAVYDKKGGISFKNTWQKVYELDDNLSPDVKEVILYNVLQIRKTLPSTIKTVIIYDEFVDLPWDIIKEIEVIKYDIAFNPITSILYTRKSQEKKSSKIGVLLCTLILATLGASVYSLISQRQLLQEQEQLTEALQSEVLEEEDYAMACVLKCIEYTKIKPVKIAREDSVDTSIITLYYSSNIDIDNIIKYLQKNQLTVEIEPTAEYNQIIKVFN